MFLTEIFPDAFRQVYEPPPPGWIWEWADKTVWLEKTEAAEAGPYRSAKTIWTRRLQEVGQDPRMFVLDYSDPMHPRWAVVPVKEFNAKKSSQSGFSEACLNIIRWLAKFRPCNIIYGMDTREEARNIITRLKPSLEKIDADVFESEEKKEGSLILALRGMLIWFFGSFSSGKYANKQAPFIVNDEFEEHKKAVHDTASDRALASRRKTADDGLQVNISKPKLRGGPICKAFDRGNQEEFHVCCPSCHQWQWFSFFEREKDVPFSAELMDVEIDGLRARLPVPLPLGQTRKAKTGRVVFDHCKNHLNEWDLLRVVREAYHECGYCKVKIPHEAKPAMVANALWLPTAVGAPGVISQHISDLYSGDAASSVGQIALDFLVANKEGRVALQGFYNHRCGEDFAEEASSTSVDDIKANIAGQEGDSIPAYAKGECPFVPRMLVLGGDVGLDYAKWALLAILPNGEDAAVIDWGEELDPSDITELMMRHTWPVGPDRKPMKITFGFLDAKYRKGDVYRACLAVPGRRLIPTAGLGGSAARAIRLYNFARVPTYQKNFRHLVYNDREAKEETYVDCIKKKRRRILFPSDVEQHKQFVAELTAEKKVLVDDHFEWDEHPGPNHWGDCVKDAITGTRFLTRKEHPRAGDLPDDADDLPAAA